jgi:hypothetical protein
VILLTRDRCFSAIRFGGEQGRTIMKMLLAAALLIGLAAFTTAHAEWEILDSGTAVYGGATAAPPAMIGTTSVDQSNEATH